MKNNNFVNHGLLQDTINYSDLIKNQSKENVVRMPLTKGEAKLKGPQKVKTRKNNQLIK